MYFFLQKVTCGFSMLQLLKLMNIMWKLLSHKVVQYRQLMHMQEQLHHHKLLDANLMFHQTRIMYFVSCSAHLMFHVGEIYTAKSFNLQWFSLIMFFLKCIVGHGVVRKGSKQAFPLMLFACIVNLILLQINLFYLLVDLF